MTTSANSAGRGKQEGRALRAGSWRAALPVVLVCLLAGCLGTATYRGARTVPAGSAVLLPSCAVSVATEGDRAEGIFSDCGIAVAVGLSERMELAAKYDFSFDVSASTKDKFTAAMRSAIHYVEVEPRFSVRPDKVALSVPLGLTFGREGPALGGGVRWYLTHAQTAKVDLNLTPSVLTWFLLDERPVGGVIAGLNAGLGLNATRGLLQCYPEIGIEYISPQFLRLHTGVGLELFRHRR